MSLKYNVSLDYLLGLTNTKRDYNIQTFNKDIFLSRLKQEINKKKYSQASIANILSITKATYSKYELEIITSRIDKIIILANLYKISIDYLIGKKN